MNLNPQRAYLEQVARERLRNNRTEWQVDDYGEEIELIGAAGELAARRFLKLPEELHTRFDQGADILWRGHRIDVKTTRLTERIQFRYLQWPQRKPIKADLVMMAAFDPRSWDAEVLGYTFKQEILNAPLNRTRAHPCYELSVMKLHSPWNLFSSEVIDETFSKYLQAGA
jgi:hypothetical protein